MGTPVQIARDLEAVAKLRDVIDNWRADKGDGAGVHKVYSNDRKALRKVLALYEWGRWEEAKNLAYGLDTILREKIPKGIWDHIIIAGESDSDGIVPALARLDELPEACPLCGDDVGFMTAVDVTVYNGQDNQFNGVFNAEGKPVEQPVRVYCEDCDVFFPITEKLAEKLIYDATDV